MGGNIADPAAAMRHVLRPWPALARTARRDQGPQPAPQEAHQTAAPELVDAFGIGPDIAAEMFVTAGDNTDRIHSEAALAKLCGACPIPAIRARPTAATASTVAGTDRPMPRSTVRSSSACAGTTHHHYVERRTAEGLSKKEIIRCLKRYVAREIYRLLPAPMPPSPAPAS